MSKLQYPFYVSVDPDNELHIWQTLEEAQRFYTSWEPVLEWQQFAYGYYAFGADFYEILKVSYPAETVRVYLTWSDMRWLYITDTFREMHEYFNKIHREDFDERFDESFYKPPVWVKRDTEYVDTLDLFRFVELNSDNWKDVPDMKWKSSW